MTNKTEVKRFWRTERAALPAGYRGTIEGPFITAMRDQSGVPRRMAMYAKHTKKGASSHTAYIAFDGEQWHMGCSNRLLEGTMDLTEAESLASSVATSKKEKTEILSKYSAYSADTKCHFWTAWKSNKICKHVKDLLNDIKEFDIEELEEVFNDGIGAAAPSSTSSTTATETSYDLVAAKLQQYGHKRHLLITGEKGSGKTRGVYEHLEKEGLPHIFIGGDADVEAIDLKGMLIPAPSGDKLWVDGPLTEAFRRAAAGEKIVLFIDEMLRISPSGLSALIPALTLNHKNEYVLKTGRIIDVKDGVARTETLFASRDNLWVIATTNIGAGYDVSALDDALEDRFEYVEHNNELGNISTVVTTVVAELGIDNDVAVKLLSFYKKMRALYDAEELTKLINMRHLVQIAEDCEGDASRLLEVCMDRIPKWVERDMHGKLVEEQIKIVKKALASAGIK